MNNYKLSVIIKMHFVNVLSTKVLIEDTIFMSPTGDKTSTVLMYIVSCATQRSGRLQGKRKNLHLSVILYLE